MWKENRSVGKSVIAKMKISNEGENDVKSDTRREDTKRRSKKKERDAQAEWRCA